MLAAYIHLGECFAQPISISLAKLVGWRGRRRLRPRQDRYAVDGIAKLPHVSFLEPERAGSVADRYVLGIEAQKDGRRRKCVFLGWWWPGCSL